MRSVHKSKPGPQCLDEYTLGTDWDDVLKSCKDDVRKRLVDDQRGICCYCMARIRVDAMKVEHFLAQSKHLDKRTDWTNLLGACVGGDGGPREFRSCDTQKQNEDIQLHPLDPNLGARIRYSADGKVQSSEHQDDLDARLNLNHARLVNNRIAAWKRYRIMLERKLGKDRTWPAAALARELEVLRNAPEHLEFVGYIESLLERLIRSRSVPRG